ncbi:MAG: ATP-binding protein, partial [Bacteroidota bacterium]
MHLNINRTLRELSRSLISSTKNRTEAELNHFFESVDDELLKACKMGESGIMDALDIATLNQLFVPLLWQSQQISSIQIASSEGIEYMLMRRDKIWINRRIDGNGTRNWTHWQGLEAAAPQLLENRQDQNKVPPQEKDWYQGAIQQEGEASWSSPYHFKTAQNTGMTVSRRFRSRKRPDLDFVIAVDVLLEDVSRFTMSMKSRENDQEFVITPDGLLVGIPRDPDGQYEASFKDFLLQPVSGLQIAPLTEAVQLWQQMEKQGDQIFAFQNGQEKWWGGIRPFVLGNGQQTLYLGVIVPEADFLPSVQQTRNIISLGWALIISLVVVIGFSYYRQRKAQQALHEQQKQVELEHERAEKLEQLDQLKDEFLANTSHELRTPLNGIIGITESLYDEIDQFPPQELRKNLSMVIASGKRLSTLVNDLLDFSKLRNHSLSLQTKAIDLRSLSDVILKLISPLVGRKELVLVNDIPEDLAAVEADENRIQQILYNLIGNAIKFTEKGSVTLSARQEGDLIEVFVTDTGIGIPKEKQESIFTLFEQGDGAIARKYGGTGLGLTITRRLVEAHGGRLGV